MIDLIKVEPQRSHTPKKSHKAILGLKCEFGMKNSTYARFYGGGCRKKNGAPSSVVAPSMISMIRRRVEAVETCAAIKSAFAEWKCFTSID